MIFKLNVFKSDLLIIMIIRQQGLNLSEDDWISNTEESIVFMFSGQLFSVYVLLVNFL